MVCETRESADFSRSELPDILEFMKQIQPLKSNPILPYENDLLAKKEKFINTFSSEVSKKHLETINTYLNNFVKQNYFQAFQESKRQKIELYRMQKDFDILQLRSLTENTKNIKILLSKILA